MEMEERIMRLMVKAILTSPLRLHQIAVRARVSKWTLLTWIDGTVKGPRITNLARVAHVLGFSIEMNNEMARLVPHNRVNGVPVVPVVPPWRRMSSDELHQLLRSLQ